jgi:hypothetical protein
MPVRALNACLQLQSAGVNVPAAVCGMAGTAVACNEQRLQHFAVWLSRGNEVVQPTQALRTQWKTIAMLDADCMGCENR